jgi:hypothetical protein
MHRRQGFSAREISEVCDLNLKLKEVEYVIWRLTRMLMEEFGRSDKDPPEESSRLPGG